MVASGLDRPSISLSFDCVGTISVNVREISLLAFENAMHCAASVLKDNDLSALPSTQSINVAITRIRFLISAEETLIFLTFLVDVSFPSQGRREFSMRLGVKRSIKLLGVWAAEGEFQLNY